MADLDAELLALAGDSDEEAPLPTTERDGSRSPSHSPAPPTSSKPAAKKRKAPRKARKDESEEEGEASSGSDVESVAMSESDRESSPGSDNAGLFPLENKYYNLKDKNEILALPEIEREAILADRAALVERRQQDNVLKSLYKRYQEPDSQQKEKKRKVGDAKLEDGERKSSRQRTTLDGRKVGEQSDALKAYKAQREKKGQLEEQRKLDAADRKAGIHRQRSQSPGSDDAQGDSDVEWDAGPSRDLPKPLVDEPAELSDYNRLIIGRENFAQVCFYPGFEAAVKDCYVRVAVSGDKQTGQPSYVMAKIKAITEGKEYAMETKQGKKFTTTQHVLSQVGKAEREWPFIFCSMGKISEREFSRYKSMVTNDNMTLPKKSHLAAKTQAITALINHRFTEAELQEKLKKSGVLDQRNKGVLAATLEVRKGQAEALGDLKKAAELEQQIKELRTSKLAWGTSITIPAGNGVSVTQNQQQQRLAELNKQNRKLNTQTIRRAQLAERKAAAELRAAVERGEAVADPFARVKVMPKTHFNADNVPLKPDVQPKTETSTDTKSKDDRDSSPPEDDLAAIIAKRADPTSYPYAPPDFWSTFGAYTTPDGQRKSVFKTKISDDEILHNIDLDIDFKVDHEYIDKWKNYPLGY